MLCIINDDQAINWPKKCIKFVKIKFHLNENYDIISFV